MKVHELIRQARLARGMSLAQLAAQLPASKSHIHNLETNKRSVDGMTATRLSLILKDMRIVWAWLRSQPGGQRVLPHVPSEVLDLWPAWGKAIGAVARYEQWLRATPPGTVITSEREPWALIQAVLMHLNAIEQSEALEQAG